MHNILQIYAEIYENIANDVHMGRYDLILGANESYIDNKAIGTSFDPISANTKIRNPKHIQKTKTKI